MITLNKVIIDWDCTSKQLIIENKKGNIDEFVPIPYKGRLLKGWKEKNSFDKPEKIRYLEEENSLFHPLLLREETTYFLTVLITKKELKDNKGAIVGPFIEKNVNDLIEFYPKKLWKEKTIEGKEFIEIYGELNTKNFVGQLNLSIGEKESFFCEVAAKKINYLNDYRNFLNDIADESVYLMMQYSGLSNIKAINDLTVGNKFSQIIQIRSVMKDVPIAIDLIIQRMHNVLETEFVFDNISRIKNPSIINIITRPYNLDLKQGGILKEKFNGYTPSKLVQQKKEENIDTPENRYIKNFLEELHFFNINLYRSLEQRVTNGSKSQLLSMYKEEVLGWIKILESYLNLNFFKRISRMTFFPSNSQVLQNRAGYRDILLLDLKLQNGLYLNWNPLTAITSDINVKPIYELYEIWCFFMLRNSLREILGPEINSKDLFEITDGNISFNLKKGNTSCLVFKKNQFDILFYYNKEFSRTSKNAKSYSLKFKPDFTIEIRNKVKPSEKHYLHLDSKYRVNTFLDIETSTETKSSKKEDLIKMHAYRDAIVGSLGSYVLFPGDTPVVFKMNQTLLPGVGAIPLGPSQKESRDKVTIFLKEVLSEIFNLNS